MVLILKGGNLKCFELTLLKFVRKNCWHCDAYDLNFHIKKKALCIGELIYMIEPTLKFKYIITSFILIYAYPCSKNCVQVLQ